MNINIHDIVQKRYLYMKLCKKYIFCTLNCCAEERFCGKQRIMQNDFVVQCTSKHIILLSLCVFVAGSVYRKCLVYI